MPEQLLEYSTGTWRIHLGDFNGDGRTDILRTSDDPTKNRLLLSNGKGLDDAGVVTVPSMPEQLLEHSTGTWRIHLGDFNGDGRTDILRTSNDPTKNRLLLSNG